MEAYLLAIVIILSVIFGTIALYLIFARVPNPCAHEIVPTLQPGNLPATTPLNKVLFCGTHNSCHVASFLSCCVTAWRYTLPTVEEQLERGLRHVELDIWYNFSSGAWEIFHLPVIDAVSNAPNTVKEQLEGICKWSAKHSDHYPVWVTLDIKGGYSPLCCSSFVPKKTTALDELPATAMAAVADAVIEGMGDRAIRIEQLQRGESSLLAGVQKHGYPALQDHLGRFFFTVSADTWQREAAKGVIFKKGSLDPGEKWSAPPADPAAWPLDPDAAFYEEGNLHKAKHLLDQDMVVRCCLMIQDSDHDEVDPDRLAKLLPMGLQYIASNCVDEVIANEAYRQDSRSGVKVTARANQLEAADGESDDKPIPQMTSVDIVI